MSVETQFLAPLNHYAKYKEYLQDFVWLSMPGSPEMAILQEALDVISMQSGNVDDTLLAISASIQLLNIQNQCKFVSHTLRLSSFVVCCCCCYC
jgi:hypothetical protein